VLSNTYMDRAGFAALLILAAYSSPANAQSMPDLRGQSFVFAGFGGDLQANQTVAWLNPFSVASGVRVTQTDAPNRAALRTQQQANNVSVDVMQIEASEVTAHCGTIFQKVSIDRSQINPKLDNNNCGVPVVLFSYVLAYNSKKYPIPPATVADFFDMKRFPGVRVASSLANSGVVESALLADGVTRSNVYPIDLDRALAKIKAARDSIEVRDSFALIQDGLANGEFDMALLPNARAMNAARMNPAIAATFNGAVTIYDNLAIPTGAKNVRAATAFLQYVALHSTQNALTARFPYGVGTLGAVPTMTPKALEFYPGTHSGQLLVQDRVWWGQNLARVRERLASIYAR
jgi:putative spermidine/putrescine transport system substrate-binding protein